MVASSHPSREISTLSFSIVLTIFSMTISSCGLVRNRRGRCLVRTLFPSARLPGFYRLYYHGLPASATVSARFAGSGTPKTVNGPRIRAPLRSESEDRRLRFAAHEKTRGRVEPLPRVFGFWVMSGQPETASDAWRTKTRRSVSVSHYCPAATRRAGPRLSAGIRPFWRISDTDPRRRSRRECSYRRGNRGGDSAPAARGRDGSS